MKTAEQSGRSGPESAARLSGREHQKALRGYRVASTKRRCAAIGSRAPKGAARLSGREHQKALDVVAGEAPQLAEQLEHLRLLRDELAVGAAHFGAALEGQLALVAIVDAGRRLAHARLQPVALQPLARVEVDVARVELRELAGEAVYGEGLPPLEAPVPPGPQQHQPPAPPPPPPI